MRDAKSWLILVVAVGALGGWAGCSGKRISTVGDMDTGAGGAGDTPASTAGSKAMAGSGASSQPPSSCADEAKSAGETDIDCGGAECASCPVGASCEKHRDCDSSVCRAGTCKAPTCADGVANSDESDVDCGGVGMPGEPRDPGDPELPAPSSACPRCETGQACRAATDCDSSHCDDGKCAAATCTDAIRNGAESDVDCGGPSCAPCVDTQYCNVAADCDSVMCMGGRCISCQDGVLNGTETDVDCGGGACDKCAVDAECNLPEDCEDGVCLLHQIGRVNRCYPAHCGNGIQDAGESDWDCGGECQPCTGGFDCNVDTDCMNYNCESGGCAVACQTQAECGDQGECVAKRCVECDVPSDCPVDFCGGEPCACKHNLCRPESAVLP